MSLNSFFSFTYKPFTVELSPTLKDEKPDFLDKSFIWKHLLLKRSEKNPEFLKEYRIHDYIYDSLECRFIKLKNLIVEIHFFDTFILKIFFKTLVDIRFFFHFWQNHN